MSERKTMRAFVVEASPPGVEPKCVGRVKDVDMPVAGPGDALIRVLRAGVCNTDLEILAGYMGFEGIVGHEFVGVVESINQDQDRSWENLVGRRVCGDINLACTECHVCKAGGDRARNHCPERTVLGILGKHGTYAEYLTLPCRNLHVVPDEVTDAEAVFVEPLAAACRILEQGLAPAGVKAAVLGDGKLGLLIAEVLSRRERVVGAVDEVEEGGNVCAAEGDRGDRGVTLIGRHPEKMDLCCRPKTGIDLSSSKGDPLPSPSLWRVDANDKDQVSSMAGEYDVVVDATGSPNGLSTALALCQPLGTVVLKSTCAAGAGFNAAPVVINEQRVVGSRCGPFPAALSLLSRPGGADVKRYISGEYTLEEAASAVEAAGKKGVLKIQILCS